MLKRSAMVLTLGALALLLLLAACAAPAAPSPTAAPKPAAPTAAPAAAKPTAAQGAVQPTAAAAATKPAAAVPATGKPIKLGFVWGLTGPIADVSQPNSVAMRAYMDWLNKNGGINGRPVEMVEVDTKYQVPLAVEGYKKVKQDGVVAVVLMSTGDTEALSAQINEDKLTSITYSCAQAWADSKKNPFIFTICTTYEDQMLDIIQFIKERWKESRPAKIAFAYPDNPFGRTSPPVGKAAAVKLGMQVVGEEIVDFGSVDTTSQMLKLKQANPDFVIIVENNSTAAVILRDGKKVGLTAQFIGENYAFDDTAIKAAGSAAEGYIGVGAMAFPSADLPLGKEMKEGAPSLAATMNLRHIQGWSLGKVLAAGLKKAGADPTPQSFKVALETMGAVDVGQATPEWKYTTENHGPTDKVVFYQVKDGKPVLISGVVSPPKLQ